MPVLVILNGHFLSAFLQWNPCQKDNPELIKDIYGVKALPFETSPLDINNF